MTAFIDFEGGATYAGDGSSGYYITNGQLEAGAFPTSAITTTSASVTRAADTFNIYPIPTMPHNLLTYSQEFDNAAWTKTTCNITANATTAPNGTTTAEKLYDDSTVTTGHYLVRALTKAATATQYTLTLYAKTSEYNTIMLRGVGTWPNRSEAVFNLSDGSTSSIANVGTFSGASVSATSVGNGWWRCSLTFTTDTDVTLSPSILLNGGTSYSGNGSSGTFIWGAQLNTGSTALTYLPTTTVARSTGTLFVEFEAPYLGTANFPPPATLCLNGSEGTNRMHVLVSDGGSDDIKFDYFTSGVAQAGLSLSGAVTPNTVYRAIGTFDTNDIRAIRNGGSVSSDVLATMFTPDKFLLGQLTPASNLANCFIRRFYVFADTFTSTELATMVG